ncbi:methylmalonyl Co-A mutase-associated GTPase MeaB [Haloterrigena alkaliphila]|uniref:Methylmalonyl Co-A mutase-associated GTPase MeaB n=1 Tax=Haloterrigena alkaliphila TaxID=2816475 RepID=A0A8A2V9A5_9EURY|nr:methylmalonyl Co-A mutase-associated GTPase MeaB [Haloterrigena alkaliphila]QSW97626.1 methylmalonyl Co-A mutase-associated GTPase MeaB [Haloterrigena alkaliphila]
MSGTDLAVQDLNGDLHSLVEGVLDGNQLSLSRLISRIENGAPGYQDAVKVLHEHATGTRTIGITGQPGSGKSTLVDKLVDKLREQGLTVGVIAVDPSSPYSGGSVLGDRVRQTSRNEDPNVFFRSMSARGHVGGLAAATFDVVHAMDAFGKDVILIETVGAGQNEVEIVRAADTVCVVAIPGAGDDVQANKAGILEIADVFAVNKADLDGATATAQELQQMIRIGQDLERSDAGDPADDPDTWVPRVELTVATKGEGVDDLVDAFDDHYAFLEESGELAETRARRFEQEVRTHLGNELDHLADDVVEARRDLLTEDSSVDPYTTSEELVVPFRRAVEEYLRDD